MHIKSVSIKKVKRFTDLKIVDLPSTAQLIIMTGPNGCGKSSLFDAFMVWASTRGRPHLFEAPYHAKYGEPAEPSWGDLVNLQFYEQMPTDDPRRVLYIRSAYRNEPAFQVSGLHRVGSPLDQPQVNRMIDSDSVVSSNYQRLVSTMVDNVFQGADDQLTVKELREKLIGDVQRSMASVFDDLALSGPGDPMSGGTFLFQKGVSRDFPYMNLSGGEKAAFDLLLDLIVKRGVYNDTIFCIDEPDLHMHSRLQGRLLEEIVHLIPSNCQLWLATHSIGMMAKAKEMWGRNPEAVLFLDFYNHDFDQPLILRPENLNRAFWKKSLKVALDDLATLVAPQQVVLCEGKPRAGEEDRKAEFDARCYRTIFSSEFCDTDFLSIGNQNAVISDAPNFGLSITTLAEGVKVVRLVDRDDMSDQEVKDLRSEGVRVLGRRHLECYLLDDTILERLCSTMEQPEKLSEVLKAKTDAIAASVSRENPSDDMKSASGSLYVELKRIMQLKSPGNDTRTFLRDTMAPLVTPDTAVYKELRRDIFGTQSTDGPG